LEKLKNRSIVIHFALLCAKAVLPIWENWVKNKNNLTQEQKDAPKKAIEAIEQNKSQEELKKAAISAYSSSRSVSLDIIRYAAMSAGDVCFAADNTLAFLTACDKASSASSRALSSGLTRHKVYEFYVECYKMNELEHHKLNNNDYKHDFVIYKILQEIMKKPNDPIDPNDLIPIVDRLQELDYDDHKVLSYLSNYNNKIYKSNPIIQNLL
jgi:hypothetical protein